MSTEKTPIPSASRSRTVKRLSHREPLPKRWDRRLSHLVEVSARPLMRMSIYLSIILVAGFFVHHLYAGDRFRLDSVRVTGTVRLSPEQISALLVQELGVDPGVSMFAFSARRAADKIRKIPAVEKCQVRKVWPNALEIVVHERRAEAVFASDKGTYVVDESGRLFAQATAEDLRALDGPVLGGWDNLHLERGSRIPKDQFARLRSELELLRRASTELYSNLSEARWQQEEGLSLILTDGGVIQQGFIRMEQAGPIIETILEDRTRSGMLLDRLRLMREKSVAVAWRPAPAPVDLIVAEKD
jgi:cell division septal protein FtsQ